MFPEMEVYMKKKLSIGKRMLNDMIHYRSGGKTISETAFRLGIPPWTVAYWTRFIKVCVSMEELMWLEEEATRHKFNTVGELLMDVFNKSYEVHYDKKLKKVS